MDCSKISAEKYEDSRGAVIVHDGVLYLVSDLTWDGPGCVSSALDMIATRKRIGPVIDDFCSTLAKFKDFTKNGQ